MPTAWGQNRSDFQNAYPQTQQGTVTDNLHGNIVADPYRWLEDDRSSETAEWVKAQNAVTDAYLANIPFREKIKARLTKLWNYEKFSAPFKEGDYTYYYKNNGLQNQSVLYRQKGTAAPEVFLDPNTFSADGTTSLTGLEFTKDGSLCAYMISEGGSDWGKIIVMDASTRKKIGAPLENIKFSGIAWRGKTGFYYSTYDVPTGGSQLSAKTDQHKLYFHKIDGNQADELVFGGSATPRRYIGGYLTEDEKFLVITAANATYGNELYVQSLKEPKAEIVPIVTGFDSEQDVIHSENDKLFIITNLDAPNKKIVTVPAKTPSSAEWKTLIPEAKFPLVASTCGGKIFTQYLKDAVSQVSQYGLDGKLEREIALPGLGTASGFSGKRSETELFYTYVSYVYPPTIFKYQLTSGKSEVFKKASVDFDPTAYESVQVFYTSKDGTKIPMIMTGKKGFRSRKDNPTMLYGYGGFSASITPSFSISNLAFMEADGVYAVANLRGGGEYGDEWHNAGIKMKKQNVFDDFIAAAEYLIEQGITTTDHLAISGASNGGLLIGACLTQRPDLFRVCFPAVGVMDMLRYHKFTAGAGWAYDYGTADDSPEMFEYLRGYSPVHNAKPGICYPATLVTTADHDDRVVPAHSFKFAAALQAAQKCKRPVLISIETKAGHGAGKPTAMVINEQADKWAFLFWNMGIDYK